MNPFEVERRGALPCVRIGGLLQFDPRAVRAVAVGPSDHDSKMERRSAKRG